MEALHAVVTGRVQGVSFRYHTQNTATRLDLVGWVRNLPDGSVEVLAEGSRDKLEELAKWLSKGPPFARVDRLETTWEQANGQLRGFGILR